MDKIEILKRLQEEHKIIRNNITLANQRVNDLAVMSAASAIGVGMVFSSNGSLQGKPEKSQKAIDYIYDGLNRHFAFEEEYLPPLIEPAIMQGLKAEHEVIRAKLEKARSALTDIRMDSLKEEQILSWKNDIWHIMNSIYWTIERHASKEETILREMQKAMEENKTSGVF